MQSLRHLVAVGVSVVVVANGVVCASEPSPVTQTPPASSPTPGSPVPTDALPSNPSRVEEASTPSYLNPSTNPLQFPTKPEEVQIQGLQSITLQQAYELAQRNSPVLQVARLQLERNRAALREAQAAEYPTLDLQTSLIYQDSAQGEFSSRQRTLSNGSSFDSTGNQVTSGSSTQSDTTSLPLSGTVELSYNLYNSGRVSANIQAAERQVRFSELEVERQSGDLLLNVSTDYYALQEADEQVRITLAAVTNAQISLRDAQAQERAGVGTRFDVLRAQVQLANANQELTRAVSQQQIARRQLAQRLSLPQSLNIVAADPVQIAGLWDLPLEDSIVRAFKNRAELEQQLVQREISEQLRQAALAATGPQVSLVANYNVFNSLDVSPNPGFADGYSVGARLTWNFYDGGAAQARAVQQEVDIAIAETRFTETRDQIRFQVEQAYSNLQSNFANIQTTAIALEQAREALRLARLRFQAGVGTQTEVINAETDLTRAESNRLRAILDYNRALASLQRALNNFSTVPLGAS